MGTTTSLWAVIEAMQRRLESEGFSERSADAAVTRGLAALLEITELPQRRRRHLS